MEEGPVVAHAVLLVAAAPVRNMIGIIQVTLLSILVFSRHQPTDQITTKPHLLLADSASAALESAASVRVILSVMVSLAAWLLLEDLFGKMRVCDSNP